MRVPRLLCSLGCLLAAAAVAAGCGDTSSGKGTGPGFKLVQPRVMTIASDFPFPPFEFHKGKALTGFDVALMNGIAKEVGLKPKWVNTDFDTIFTAVATGRFDVVAAAVTAYAPPGSPAGQKVQQRRRIVAFTRPYYNSLQSLTVNERHLANVRSVDDLRRGERVAVQTATTGAYWAQVKLAPRGVRLVTFGKAPDMFAALESGSVAAVVNDLPVSQDAIKAKSDLKVVQEIQTGEQYAFALAHNNPKLLAAINRALRKMLSDGRYASLFRRYFPGQPLPAYAAA